VAQPTNRILLDFEVQTKKPHGDFDAQITKRKLPVLRPKPGNPPPPWFWGSTKKLTASFKAKPGETVTTSFEVKLEKTVVTGFEVKPEKTVAAGFEAKPSETVTACFEAKPLETVAPVFEAKPPETVTNDFEVKPVKTVRVVLRSNHSQTIVIGFDVQTDEKPSQWFWGQTTDKPSTMVLRLNQEICAPRLYVHGADRTRCHPTSRSPGHRVSDLCDHSRSSAPGLLLLSWSSSLHAPATCTPRDKQMWFSKRNKDKRKIKQNYPGFESKPRQVNDSSQSNQGAFVSFLMERGSPRYLHGKSANSQCKSSLAAAMIWSSHRIGTTLLF
jgi:hypothetical protein